MEVDGPNIDRLYAENEGQYISSVKQHLAMAQDALLKARKHKAEYNLTPWWDFRARKHEKERARYWVWRYQGHVMYAAVYGPINDAKHMRGPDE